MNFEPSQNQPALKRKKLLRYLIILAVIAALIIILSSVKISRPVPAGQELSSEQKQAILDQLSGSGPALTPAQEAAKRREQEKILKSLSSTGKESQLSDEEKLGVLESLQ